MNNGKRCIAAGVDGCEQIESETFALQTHPNGSYRVWGEGPTASTHDSLALGLGKFYQDRLGQRVLAKAQEELRQKIERWRSKEESELNDQQQRLKATENHAEIQQQADALLCLQHPNRDQINEAQKLYKRARKLRRSVAILNERIDHHQQRLALIHGQRRLHRRTTRSDVARRHGSKIGLQELQRELDDLLSPGEHPQSKRRQNRTSPNPWSSQALVASWFKWDAIIDRTTGSACVRLAAATFGSMPRNVRKSCRTQKLQRSGG